MNLYAQMYLLVYFNDLFIFSRTQNNQFLIMYLVYMHTVFEANRVLTFTDQSHLLWVAQRSTAHSCASCGRLSEI